MTTSSSELTPIPTLVAENSLSELRVYFETRPEEYFSLFTRYVNDREWTQDNPVLSLKAFALLDPMVQQSEMHQCTLRVIFAAEVLTKDEGGIIKNILLDAVQSSNWAFVFKLLEHGVSKDSVLTGGSTLLHLACSNAMSTQALRLLEMEARVDFVNSAGDTPLHLACQMDLNEVCKRLIERGADPIVPNEIGCTPLYYACSQGNEALIDILRNADDQAAWDARVAATYADLEDVESLARVVDRWREEGLAWGFLREALEYPDLMPHLRYCFTEEIKRCQDRIRERALDMGLEKRLAVLPELAPEQIIQTMCDVPDGTLGRWLNQFIVVEEVERGENVVNTIDAGIREVYDQWIGHIDWDDGDPSSYSGYLANCLFAFFSRVPLPALSAAAMCVELCPILESCIRVFGEDQMAVVIPHFTKERFVEIAGELSPELMCRMLLAATAVQKAEFVKKWPVCDSPHVRKWYLEDYEALTRGLEKVVDHRMKGDQDPEALFAQLLERYEQASLRLPYAAKRGKRHLQRIKAALLANGGHEDVARFVETSLDRSIARLDLIPVQLERLNSSLRKDPLYGVIKGREVVPPDDFVCGITGGVMVDPVKAHGHTFEKEAIERWLEQSDKCPLCLQEVAPDAFVPDGDLRVRIEQWRQQSEHEAREG